MSSIRTITMLGASCGARSGWMVGARASRASRAGGDATLAWGIGSTVRLLIGVCARAPVIVPNAARIAVLAVVKSRLRRFMGDLHQTSLCCYPACAGRNGIQEGSLTY